MVNHCAFERRESVMRPVLKKNNLLLCMIIFTCIILAARVSPVTAGDGSHCPCLNGGLIIGMSHQYLDVYCSEDWDDAYVAMVGTSREPGAFAGYGTGYDGQYYYCNRYTTGFPRPGTDYEYIEISSEEYQHCHDAISKAIAHGLCNQLGEYIW